MSSEFNSRLDELEEFLDNSWTLPLATDKYIVSGEKLRNIILSLRASLPPELKKANDVIASKEKTISNATEEAKIITERAKKSAEIVLIKAKKAAEDLIEKSRSQAEEMINEQEIINIANERAAKIVEQAKQDAIKMRNVTLNYIDSVVTESERSLTTALGKITQLKQSYSGGNKPE